MRALRPTLLNTPDIELWPGGLLRARANHDARILARAIRVLRRKRDGRYLAAELPEGLMPLLPRWQHEPGIDEALDRLDAPICQTRRNAGHANALPLHRLEERLDALGIDADAYMARTGLALVPEPDHLAYAGRDRYHRPLWLHAGAARAWGAMREAAYRDGVVLDAISGYRSHDYQLGIFARKLTRGLSIERILAVNAAPGFSEHHDGRALDIGTPGEPPAEETFETTPAFDWLQAHAGAHGFRMSYPRDNPHDIVYEPWHWRFSNKAE
ncbi:D-alanyl-D-alanine carboxypeptidase family protein [Luteimonas aestuarii]|uniref:D-alanyl-D-alanine carboxypeptidase family protein n=1 Tax=Luteimonas aestuarii TaxID=453837 RepID=A0A4V6PLQ0_9GAMM|nr:M15 family metallopeptidase [Luteimonas aestuarii]TDK25972.1 D-alanyl-D-alanine carboxypeptidase family protein [Luteimonas aestuarii]